ncbi:hypothetical protein BaRGS_00021119 [Batillaria attramentaria]|uniref:Uncharacterized protein n=1 Tax=Batillaria attramentaria TaxID=370345 RepID=A0ABD0KKE4_9CAEN
MCSIRGIPKQELTYKVSSILAFKTALKSALQEPEQEGLCTRPLLPGRLTKYYLGYKGNCFGKHLPRVKGGNCLRPIQPACILSYHPCVLPSYPRDDQARVAPPCGRKRWSGAPCCFQAFWGNRCVLAGEGGRGSRELL